MSSTSLHKSMLKGGFTSLSKMAVPGVYTWLYGGGSFPVCLRPSGVFYCQQYASSAKWEKIDGGSEISIDWKNFGQYHLKHIEAGHFEGSQIGKPANWRKMSYLRPFSAHETLMMGTGAGSAWNFEWEKGSFEVEFRCDGFNHFVCNTYPAHSHWAMEDDKILINWDKYGKKIPLRFTTYQSNYFKLLPLSVLKYSVR